MSDEHDVLRVGLVATSDRASQGIYRDEGIPTLEQWLAGALLNPVEYEKRLIPDERAEIEKTLIELVDQRGCHLVITTGGVAGRAFVLQDGLTIGRSPGRADFVLSDPEVSSLHARVERDGGPPILIDADSTNGTFVNDERITSRPLQPGDRVRLGGVQMVVEAAG